MPKGKFLNHKGRSRRFTNPFELEKQRQKDEHIKKWRKQRGDELSTDEEGGEENKKSPIEETDSSDDDDETDSSSSEDEVKAKGVSNLIEIENPNRIQKKNKKLTALETDVDSKPQLSRKQREEIEKQRAQAHYQKLHAEGKTEQARADLARLAIIKQQREEAKKRREEEQKVKEEALKMKVAQTQKALGKK